MTDHDHQLREALRRRAEFTAPAPLALGDVVSRASAIRRRRRTTASVAVAAAVAAIAVPTALALGPHDDAATPTGPSATPSPTASATPSPSTTPSPTPSSTPSAPATTGPGLADLALSGKPPVDYAIGRTVHLAGGGTATLPVAGATSFVDYHGGWLVTTTDTVRDTVTEYDSSGKLLGTHPGSGPVLSQDGTETAWWWQDGAHGSGHVYTGIRSGMSDSQGVFATPAGREAAVVGFGPNGVVWSTDNAQGTDHQVWTLDANGKAVRIDGLVQASAVLQAPALVAGAAGHTGTIGCPSVFTLPRLVAKWRDCSRNGVLAFGSDGRYGLEVDQGTGASSTVRIVDAATGRLVTSYTPKSPLALDGPTVWSPDGDQVVLEVFDSSAKAWALVRLTATGSVDRVTDLVPGDANHPPFILGPPL